MKSIASGAMTAIEAGEAIVTGAVEMVPRDPLLDPIRVWGGYGPITIDGDEYLGLGNSAIAQQTNGALGGVAQGLTLTLSGVEPAALALLDAHVFDRGRIDTVETEEVIGGPAAINASVESAARGLGRSGARMRADSDQRLISATDGYFKFTAFAPEKMLYWGGKKPSRAGSAIGSGGGFGGGMLR